MTDFKTTILFGGKNIDTLQDILPKEGGYLKILFVGKTPAPVSVKIGHYFQGRQGKSFWNKLIDHGILEIKPNSYEDENLLAQNFGITDIVKVPREYTNEPSKEEYRAGFSRIMNLIEMYRPKVTVFIYKRVLDEILAAHGKTEKSIYGFNPSLEKFFNSKVFVFPMPGTPCTKETSDIAMKELKTALS